MQFLSAIAGNPPRQTLDVSKKRGIKVVSISGDSWTSAKGALRMLKRGTARYVDEHTIEMIQEDYRHLSEGRQPAPSRIPAVVATNLVCISDSGEGGFLRYPQRSLHSGPAYPGLARKAA